MEISQNFVAFSEYMNFMMPLLDSKICKHEIKSALYKFLFFKKLPCRLKSATYILTALPHLQLHSIFSNLPLHYCKYVVNLSILGKPILSIHLLYGRSSWPNINISKPRIEQFFTASLSILFFSLGELSLPKDGF